MGYGKFTCPNCGNEELKNTSVMCIKCNTTNFRSKYNSISKEWVPTCMKCGSGAEDHIELESKCCSKCKTKMEYKIQDNLPNISPRVNDPTSDKFWKNGLSSKQIATKLLGED